MRTFPRLISAKILLSTSNDTYHVWLWCSNFALWTPMSSEPNPHWPAETAPGIEIETLWLASNWHLGLSSRFTGFNWQVKLGQAPCFLLISSSFLNFSSTSGGVAEPEKMKVDFHFLWCSLKTSHSRVCDASGRRHFCRLFWPQALQPPQLFPAIGLLIKHVFSFLKLPPLCHPGSLHLVLHSKMQRSWLGLLMVSLQAREPS